MSRHTVILVLAVVLTLSGCSGVREGTRQGAVMSWSEAPANARARIVVYRPSTLDHFQRSPEIDLNGVPACDLPNGEAFFRDIEPGSVTVSTSLWDWPGTSRLAFRADEGRTYFVRMSPNAEKRLAGLLGGHPGVWIAEALAERGGPFLLDLTARAEALASLESISAAECIQAAK